MSGKDPERQRLRFTDYHFERFPNSRCRVSVAMEWTEGRLFRGEAEGTDTFQGRIRLGATACIRAAQSATNGRLAFELRGAKAVRAFDSWIVVVSLRATGDDDQVYQLLGSYAAPDEDVARGASLAVLDATNRILVRYVDEV